MRISTVRIQNLRSIIDSDTLELGPITLVVGKNNTGKSTILRGVHSLQATGGLSQNDLRYGQAKAAIDFRLTEIDRHYWGPTTPIAAPKGHLALHLNLGPSQIDMTLDPEDGISKYSVGGIGTREPDHFIYPYLSGRKVAQFEELIDEERSRAVKTNLSNLAPKVDKLMDGHHPNHPDFDTLVKEVIGLPLSAIASGGGKKVGMWVNGSDWIPLENMGDGVAQMLGLITQICLAKCKLFLIEELENDIHPEGLKALLRVIEERSVDNQFVISTHNNIVLRHLGAIPTTVIYEVTSQDVKGGGYTLPSTNVQKVGNDVHERSRLLESLGYELSDFDLFDGWLILEESSAERIIRDHLVRWFAPGLSRIRVVASQGTSDIERSFEALDKLVLFTHLQARYRGRVLVIADGDQSGQDAIARLETGYKSWPSGSFVHLREYDFERYYPARFKAKADAALGTKGKQEKWKAKKALLYEVLSWIEANEDEAKAEFEASAVELIGHLRKLEKALAPASDTVRG